MINKLSGPKRKFSALSAVCKTILKETKEAGTFKVERVIENPQGMEIIANGKKVINFCANNYLGLSNHPRVTQAAKDMIDTHGFGMASVRFICGTQDKHKELESAISTFHQTDDTILYPSCFDANAGLFEALLTDEDCVISDTLNHASIIDGIRLCKAKRQRYQHLDMHDLEEQLKASMDKRIRMIVTDGVFSMDGDIAPLPEIVALAKKYDAVTFIDECHGTGVFGQGGKGTPEYFGLEGEIDIINSTLGKALGGGTGGYTSASQEVVDVLRQRGRPYLFSNSIAPAVVGASLEVFQMLGENQDLITNLRVNTKLFRSSMKAAGFNLMGHDDCPIAPIYFGDARLAGKISEELMNRFNIFVIAFSFPVVPKDHARIRCQLSGAHTTKQIEQTVAAFVEVGRELGVIPNAKL